VGLPAVVSAATYTAKGEPTKNSMQAGGMEKGQTFGYNADGRVSQIGIIASWASDVSLATSYVPSALGPISSSTTGTSISPALGQAWTYNDRGAVASYTNAQGVTTSYTYDLRGRLLTIGSTGSPTLSYSYPNNERSRNWSQGRVSGSESYDGFGRLQSKLRADGVTESYTYDTYARLIAVNEAVGGSSRPAGQKGYDALGRVTNKQPASGPGSSYAYSASGSNQVITITTTDGLTYTQTLDPWGQMVASTDPTGTTTTTAYNQFGQATQVTQNYGGINQIRSFGYDGIGKLQIRTEPETKTTTYSAWNAQGLPGSVVDSKRTLTITYDALGRRRSVSNGSTNLTYSYTGALLMGTASSDGVSQGFAYNGPGGRLSSESITIDGVARTMSYGYDGYATLSTITYPITYPSGSGRVVGYGYDSSNRVNQVTNNGVSLALVGYDGWGNRTSMTFGSRANSQWTLDGFGLHLKNWTVNYTGGGDTRAYGYDTSDHLNQAGEWSLQHDKMGRLTSASGFGVNTGHGYDGFGNDTTHTVSTPAPAAFNAFGFNPLADNRIPASFQVNGGNIYTGWAYADNGEVSQIGTGVGSGRYLAMTWDAFGRLGTITDTTTAAAQSYRYTTMGMRVSLTDTSDATRNRQFAYSSGGLLLGEYLSSGTWKRDVIYLGGQPIAEVDGNGVHELHCDHLGTPRVITTASDGTVEGRQAYGPYGELIGTPTNTYGYQPLSGYTGHAQTDSTGLIYLRGRFYSPAWHRFLSSDQGADPASLNQFAYCGGNPLARTDPSGMHAVYMTLGSTTFGALDGTGVGGFSAEFGSPGTQPDAWNSMLNALSAANLAGAQANLAAQTNTGWINPSAFDVSGINSSYNSDGQFELMSYVPGQLTITPMMDDQGNIIFGGNGLPASMPVGIFPGDFVYLGEHLAGTPQAYSSLFNFRQGGDWDLQRLAGGTGIDGRLIDSSTICIGLYAAAAGIPYPTLMSIQNTYAGLWSSYPTGTPMDQTWTNLPSRNVSNTNTGYSLYNTGMVTATRFGF
jgi:RHS repeat-associated protein